MGGPGGVIGGGKIITGNGTIISGGLLSGPGGGFGGGKIITPNGTVISGGLHQEVTDPGSGLPMRHALLLHEEGRAAFSFLAGRLPRLAASRLFA